MIGHTYTVLTLRGSVGEAPRACCDKLPPAAARQGLSWRLACLLLALMST